MLYTLLLIIITVQATEDGLWERGHKKWSKRVEALGLVCMSIVPLYMPDVSVMGVVVTVLLYLFIRAYLFDPVMHMVSGWPPNYVGSTSPLWDKIMNRLHTWQFWVVRAFFLALSILFYIKAIINF